MDDATAKSCCFRIGFVGVERICVACTWSEKHRRQGNVVWDIVRTRYAGEELDLICGECARARGCVAQPQPLAERSCDLCVCCRPKYACDSGTHAVEHADAPAAEERSRTQARRRSMANQILGCHVMRTRLLLLLLLAPVVLGKGASVAKKHKEDAGMS